MTVNKPMRNSVLFGSPKQSFIKTAFKTLFILSVSGAVFATILIIFLSTRLPAVETLKDVQLQVPLRIFTQDGKLMAEYGEKRRIPVTLDETPPLLINAILATEDHRFYKHGGVDWRGLTRAAVHLIATGTKGQGGGTITMQVARNFFLSRRKAYIRKLNEILLALKIERELSKKEILELYINKIFLGHRAYGVAAAAQAYYGKNLNELTLAQMAMIAGLPKAPSRLNPIANARRAKARRHHVLARMLHYGYIDEATFGKADSAPLTASYHGRRIDISAQYVAEEVRQSLVNEFGEDVYTKGYQVYTTLDSRLQQKAMDEVRKTLIEYDKRHGYRRAEAHIDLLNDFPTQEQQLEKLRTYPLLGGLDVALVTDVGENDLDVLLKNGDHSQLAWDDIKWARRQFAPLKVGAWPKTAADIAKVGDVIRVQQEGDNRYSLAQLPAIESALVSVNPNNGAIVALVGGFSFYKSKFNRVLQAERQPGSSFKPFVYAAALAKGMTAATIINDAPIVIDDPSSEQAWRPQNDNRHFYGPTRLRIGLIRSRNLVSIRLLQLIGIDYAIDYAKKFGFLNENLPRALSLALGTASVTPMQLTTGFSVLANGGFKINPYIIDHIDNSDGKALFQANPKTACYLCNETTTVANPAEAAISPQIAYLMTQLLQDTVKHGTGRRALALHRNDLAGKTGTTNDKHDVWFAGFNKNLVTTVWLGFDNPQPIGEYASQLALPLWIKFMGEALKNTPNATLSMPPGIVTAKIDRKTGLLAHSNRKNTIFEIFRKENAPSQFAPKHPQPTPDNNTSLNSSAELF